jgi:hypothetical protein
MERADIEHGARRELDVNDMVIEGWSPPSSDDWNGNYSAMIDAENPVADTKGRDGPIAVRRGNRSVGRRADDGRLWGATTRLEGPTPEIAVTHHVETARGCDARSATGKAARGTVVREV